MTVKVKGIFIPGNVASSKNSKRIVYKESKDKNNKKKNVPLIINSKQTMAYKKATKLFWLEQKPIFKELVKNETLPLVVGFHFYRQSRREYDWINPLQLIQDLMVDYGWIEDDSTTFIMPIPFKMGGSYSTHRKEDPGVWIVPITVELLKELHNQIDN